MSCKQAAQVEWPVFQDTLIDASEGNFWPITKLGPTIFLAGPHESGLNHVIILSRFSCWKDNCLLAVGKTVGC